MRHLLLAALLLWPSRVLAADVTLAWDPPTDGVTIGYVIYYGAASGAYDRQQDAGFATRATVVGLTASTYFIVRAYDAAGDFSGPSNEVAWALPVVTSLSLTSNAPSPQQAGFYVTWTAVASGGTAPYAYQFWWQRNGGAWTLGRDWAVGSWSWAPPIGDYVIRVDARSAGGAAAELSQAMPFSVTKKCSGRNCR